jgi:hypothetical protein
LRGADLSCGRADRPEGSVADAMRPEVQNRIASRTVQAPPSAGEDVVEGDATDEGAAAMEAGRDSFVADVPGAGADAASAVQASSSTSAPHSAAAGQNRIRLLLK